ncbi:MAG: MFS transporter [Hydrogenophilus sp.]|nr:MFS transporter [Hydrogenophilus sp.]
MTGDERGVAVRLALVYALRMAGLFLALPVLAEHMRTLPGGEEKETIGLALGVYGLTQALFLLPLGWVSDRIGRKPVIYFGLALFVAGGVIAAFASTAWEMVAARALQGAGAISAAVTALVADLTTPTYRTKAMALIGASVGLSFVLSLAIAPLLYGVAGIKGVFLTISALGVTAAVVVARGVPTPPRVNREERALEEEEKRPIARFWYSLLGHRQLWRLHLGVFVLHFVQMAMWVVVPRLLVEVGGVSLSNHWIFYGVTLGIAIAAMGPALLIAEREGRIAEVYRIAILLLAVAEVLLAWIAEEGESIFGLAAVLTLFFWAFNVLEATQPSWLSRAALPQYKGATLGVYSTLQSLGLFAGGAIGGWLSACFGSMGLFGIAAVLALLWYAWAPRAPLLAVK